MSQYLNTLSVEQQEKHWLVLGMMTPAEQESYFKLIDSQYECAKREAYAKSVTVIPVMGDRRRLYKAVLRMDREEQERKVLQAKHKKEERYSYRNGVFDNTPKQVYSPCTSPECTEQLEVSPQNTIVEDESETLMDMQRFSAFSESAPTLCEPLIQGDVQSCTSVEEHDLKMTPAFDEQSIETSYKPKKIKVFSRKLRTAFKNTFHK